LVGRVIAGGPAEGDGARAARELLEGDLPTAVVCYNDRVALGLVDVLIRAGVRIPGDVSVVGFDDTPMAGLEHINLTSVAQDVGRMAQLAVARLVSRLEPERADVGQGTDRDVVLPPRLVIRGSTAPVSGAVSPPAC
jgi:DNA-binding LacI/PurR family transcriptional regulator